jgi:hypothetical protein
MLTSVAAPSSCRGRVAVVAVTMSQHCRTCLGIIVCNEPTCQIITRPATRRTTLVRQLHASCDCGGKLVHQECPGKVTYTLYRFRGGVFYEHNGDHDHARPTHILHLTKSQRTQFKTIVAANPCA